MLIVFNRKHTKNLIKISMNMFFHDAFFMVTSWSYFECQSVAPLYDVRLPFVEHYGVVTPSLSAGYRQIVDTCLIL